MKRKLLFISGLLFVATCLFAQAPTFTSSYYPHTGSTEYAQFAYISGASLGTTGTSQTWNYTALSDSGNPVTQTYVAPSSTPSYWANIYPSANGAYGSNAAGYIYTEATSNSYVILGFAGTSPGDTLRYTKDEVVFEYPFTYQSIFATVFAANSSSTADGYTGTDTRTGTDTFTADGYGTLELPGNGNHTFTNVLRTVLIEDYRDIFAEEGVPYDTIYERIYTIDYLWAGNETQPILSISNVSQTQEDVTGTASSLYYYPNSPSGIDDIYPLVENLNVFPNPSYSQSTISLSLKEASNINVYVTNIIGQRVRTIVTKQVDVGNHAYTIETGDMAKGIYLVIVEINNAIAEVRKLEIE
jgi:hypothetical protein